MDEPLSKEQEAYVERIMRGFDWLVKNGHLVPIDWLVKNKHLVPMLDEQGQPMFRDGRPLYRLTDDPRKLTQFPSGNN